MWRIGPTNDSIPLTHQTLKTNTHRRRDETVLSRRVGGVYMNSQLGHDDCRRIRRCEHSRWPWPSLQFCSQCYRSRMTKGCMFVNIRICCVVKYSWIFTIFSSMTSLCRHLSAVSTGNCKLGHDCRRVCSHRRHVRHNSTVSLRRRRRCVLDITLTPTLRVGTTPWSVRCVGLPWGRRGSMRPMRYFVAPIDGYINRFQRKTGLPSVSADCVIVSHKTCVTACARRLVKRFNNSALSRPMNYYLQHRLLLGNNASSTPSALSTSPEAAATAAAEWVASQPSRYAV